MPTYEMLVIFRVLPKEELFAAAKKAATSILKEGGILRKLDSFGVDVTLPYRMTGAKGTNKQGSLIMYTFDAPTSSLAKLRKEHSFEIDIIKSTVYSKNPAKTFECTLEEELQPAPYRKPVQDIVADQEKKKRVRFPLNTGLDFNPLP